MLKNTTFLIITGDRPERVQAMVSNLRSRYGTTPIIIVDLSKDQVTPEIELADGSEHCSLPPDTGLGEARNFAVSLVHTDYFIMLDDDLIIDEGVDFAQLKKVLSYSSLDFLAGQIIEGGRVQHNEGIFDIKNKHLNLIKGSHKENKTFFVCDFTSGFFIAKTFSVRTVSWDDKQNTAERIDFFLQAKEAELKVGYTPSVQVSRSTLQDLREQELAKQGRKFFIQMMKKHDFTRATTLEGQEVTTIEKLATEKMSFLITTFKRPECLERLLLSIAKHYPHVSEIIIGDSSRKFEAHWYRSLWDKLEKAGLKNKPLALNLPYDCGLAHARNYLVESAKGGYVVILEDDFVFTSETDVNKMRDILQDDDDVAIVGGRVMQEGRPVIFNGDIEIKKKDVILKECEQPTMILAQEQVQPCDFVLNFFIARRWVLQIHPWDAQFKIHGEHTDFFLALKQTEFKTVYFDGAEIDHQQEHGGDYKKFRKRREFYEKLFIKWDIKRLIQFNHVDTYEDGVITTSRL